MKSEFPLDSVASLDARYIEIEPVSAMRRRGFAAFLMSEPGDSKLEFVITEHRPANPGQWFELGHRWNRFGADLVLTAKKMNFRVQWRTPWGWQVAPRLMSRKAGLAFAFKHWLEAWE